jgi:hypothetical protein
LKPSFEEESLVPTNKLQNPDREKIKRAKVVIREFLDANSYLTPDAQSFLLEKLTEDRNIFNWMEAISGSQFVMDQLAANLLGSLYKPLFGTLNTLVQIGRHPVDYKSIEMGDYEDFIHWQRTKNQKGIQIVDLLPASREDLVSMSINEGGVVANIAAKAEGAASYDLNKLQTALRMADALNQTQSISRSNENERSNSTLQETLDGVTRSGGSVAEQLEMARNREFSDMSSLSEAGKSIGYNLGASGRGSIYARAKSAMAFSKRREYLDAAITAAGRGDNFAKWVVRKSDFRNQLASDAGENLVAAAHHGYPNGDQPFNMLVKIPHKAVHKDWDGTQFVLFNSSYNATKRTSWWKEIGQFSLIPKLLAYTLSIRLPDFLQESTVGTTYPFKWDIKKDDKEGQMELLRKPNVLGGRIVLDDTDKVNYSEVATLFQAEKNFIKLTKQAQNSKLDEVLKQVEQENKDFNKNTRQSIIDDAAAIRGLNVKQKARSDIRSQGLNESVEGLQSASNSLPSETVN